MDRGFCGYASKSNFSTYVGEYAGNANVANLVVGIGYYSAYQNKGNNSLFIGFESSYQNGGNNTIAIGYQAGKMNTLSDQFIVKQTNVNAVPLIQGNFSSGILTCYGGAGCWAVSSDKSLKINISNLNYGLKDVLNLTPVRYNWKNNNLSDLGFIAQDMQKIIPEIVSGGEGNMAVSYGALTPILTKAMQEQQEIIIKQNNTINKMSKNLCNLGATEWC